MIQVTQKNITKFVHQNGDETAMSQCIIRASNMKMRAIYERCSIRLFFSAHHGGRLAATKLRLV